MNLQKNLNRWAVWDDACEEWDYYTSLSEAVVKAEGKEVYNVEFNNPSVYEIDIKKIEG